MAEKAKNTGGYRRPKIGDLRKIINDYVATEKSLTAELKDANEKAKKLEEAVIEQQSETHRLHAENTKLITQIREKDTTIHQQAAHIRELEHELEIEKSTLAHRQQELDNLYSRNWWQRLFNINPEL